MKNKILIPIAALAIFASHSLAKGQLDGDVNKAIEGCKGNRGTSIGQMPWGATDKDLISYKGKNLCTNNKGRPLGENCEKTLDKLYNVASELNRMVKTGCEKFVPMFVGNKELQNCMKGGQAACSDTNRKQLAPVLKQLAIFRGKLKEFSLVMKEQQRYVAKSSENVVQVLKENEGARNTPNYSGAGYSAAQMGVSSISESDKLNNFQDAKFAQALVEEIQKKFENSEKNYANVTDNTYDQKYKPIGETFKQVEKLQSRVLREQLHGFLKAEELKLATKLYDNQLSKTETTTNQLMATNEKTTTNLNNLAGAGGALPQMAGLGAGGGSESGVAGSTGSSPSYNSVSGIQSTSTKSTDNDLTSPMGVDKQPGTLIADATDNTGKDEDNASISSSSASRSPASLKETLRKKLAAKTAAAAAGEASIAGGASASAKQESESASASVAAAGIRDVNGENLIEQEGGSTDPLLEDFAIGALDEGGFQIAGSSTDESVRELIDEFDSALGNKPQLSKEIGASESPSLFLRVRDFHGRCLKRGCVVGTGKGNI